MDLDVDGVELVKKEDGRAYYNVKGDGYRRKVSWVGPDDAFLAIDSNGDGKITAAKELSFALWTTDATDTDLEALGTAFDTNHDGRISAGDAKWNQLRVWQDKNGDGITDEGELKTLVEAGITAIDLTTAKTDWAAGGNHVTGFATYEKVDGGMGGNGADVRNLGDQGQLRLCLSPYRPGYPEQTESIRPAANDPFHRAAV